METKSLIVDNNLYLIFVKFIEPLDIRVTIDGGVVIFKSHNNIRFGWVSILDGITIMSTEIGESLCMGFFNDRGYDYLRYYLKKLLVNYYENLHHVT